MLKIIGRLRRLNRRLAKDQRGNASVEYALIAVLVGIASVAGFQLVGKNVAAAANYVGCYLGSSPTALTPASTTCTWGGVTAG